MSTPTQLWQRYLEWLYYHPDLGIYLDISRMRFSSEFVVGMEPKFAKAFADVRALEGGAIANPDEQRMVGHYWLRAPELAPTEELRQDIIDTVNRVEGFARSVHAGAIHPPGTGRFSHVLSIGIGGSALGPQFVSQALAPLQPPLAIEFIDNTDPDGIASTLHRLGDRLASTLVITISKSGGTPETANGMKEVQHAYRQAGLHFPKYAIAVTGKGSRLESMAVGEGWLDTFPMHDWVGGRTSELSAVGLLPAALQGIDIRAMLAGARMMDEATRVPSIRKNPAALLALAWYAAGNGKGTKDMVILPYKDRLALFSRYLQQLVMESLGKERDLDGNVVHQGIAVYGNKGSTDQHAYVQQLREGVNNFFATFIEVLRDRADDVPALELEPDVTSGDFLSGFLQGTRSALYDNGRDSITVTLPDVSPQTVGALIALYERAVSLYASLIHVNAYHQPGVEAGKKAAAKVLGLQQRAIQYLRDRGQPVALEELAAALGAQDDVETLYRILRHLHANHRVLLEGNFQHPDQLSVSWRSP